MKNRVRELKSIADMNVPREVIRKHNTKIFYSWYVSDSRTVQMQNIVSRSILFVEHNELCLATVERHLVRTSPLKATIHLGLKLKDIGGLGFAIVCKEIHWVVRTGSWLIVDEDYKQKRAQCRPLMDSSGHFYFKWNWNSQLYKPTSIREMDVSSLSACPPIPKQASFWIRRLCGTWQSKALLKSR